MSRVYDTEIRRQENDGTQIKKRKKNAEKLVAVQSANNLLWNSL